MNYKLIFPTYRNRYNFVRQQLQKLKAHAPIDQGLNLGTGEGDYDPMISGFTEHLTACDINENDVAFAKALNRAFPSIEYRVENALDLTFAENAFDVIVSVDVLEHVGEPEQMIKEVGRVLKPGGTAVITFPHLYFPWTYDPINRILSWFGDRKISQGAYAFGHTYLISGAQFRDWSEKYGLEVDEEHPLSGYLVGLLEVYWTGIIQSIFKENAGNVSSGEERAFKMRSMARIPSVTFAKAGSLVLGRILKARSSPEDTLPAFSLK
ncbi:MAG: methyltransferase domain-containing protein, partial [Bacteroidota bacterium]